MAHSSPAPHATHALPKHPGSQLKLTFSSGATVFYIDEKAQMPQIEVSCELTGAPPAIGTIRRATGLCRAPPLPRHSLE